mgnify:CR=1 FL=1
MDPLAGLKPLTRFSERAADYAKFRPSYPPEAIDFILEDLGDPACLIAADIGAGTGISSRLLAERGIRVIAVEPNERMRSAADPHPRVEFADGQGERTGLRDASVDLATCFQSFHWLQAESALAEFLRILKPAGRVALLWNVRDDRDAFTRGYGQVILDVAGPKANIERIDAADDLMRHPAFRDAKSATFASRQLLSVDELLGRARSASYVPLDGPDYERVMDALGRLHGAHAGAEGKAALVYQTCVYRAGRA